MFNIKNFISKYLEIFKNRFFLKYFKQYKNHTTTNSENNKNWNPITQEILAKIPSTSNIQVKNIMIPRTDVISIPINISFKELFLLLKKASHSRIPIYQKLLDDIIGILYTKDLLYFFYEFFLEKKDINKIIFENELKKIMRPPLFIPESTKALNLLRDFQRSRSHIAIVVDEHGGFSGIISLEDILEEIVGDIQDEHDNDIIPNIFKISDQNFVIDAKTPIQKLNEFFHIKLPIHNDIDTIGGFIFELFGHLPKKNDKINFENLRFKILKTQKNRIYKIALFISSIKKTSHKFKKNESIKNEIL